MKFTVEDLLPHGRGKGNDFIKLFFIESITKDKSLDKKVGRGNDEVDITVTMQGVEIDPNVFFARLQNSFEGCVKTESQKYFKEVLSNKLYEAASKIENLSWVIEELTPENILRKDEEIERLNKVIQGLQESNLCKDCDKNY